MYDEDGLVPLSALQHLAFCPRQCALIHVERAWHENYLTAEGRLLHERSHNQEREVRGDIVITRAVRLRSLRLGLVGQADVVEFHRARDQGVGTRLPGLEGWWRPFPVEYKRGQPKIAHCDEFQLCAQALCLEEMLSVSVRRGALFYGEPHRRQDVEFGPELRQETEKLCVDLHNLLASGITPRPVPSKKCRHCSLNSVCLPQACDPVRRASQYLRAAISIAESEVEQ